MTKKREDGERKREKMRKGRERENSSHIKMDCFRWATQTFAGKLYTFFFDYINRNSTC